MTVSVPSVPDWPPAQAPDCEPAQDASRRTLWLRRLPFRVRLTLSFAVVMIVLFGGLALLLQTQFAASLDQGINRSLHTHATDLASLIAGNRRLPQLPESGGAFAQIIDPQTGQVVDATPGHRASLLKAAELRQAAARPVLKRSLLLDHGDRARLLAGVVGDHVLVVGSSLAQRNRALTSLTELLFLGGPGMLVLTCLAGYVLAERALAPVAKMSARAARISGAPRGERLPVPEANDELRHLGETLNEMLTRLEDALARERALVADAGHELRTPLSILKLELELALASDITREELQTRVRSAAEEVDRLAQLAQDLLVIARAELGRLPIEKRRLEVQDVLSAVAERFAAPAASSGRPVTLEDSNAIIVNADADRIEQAMTNLVSNALRHGDGPVTLRATEHNGSIELHVLDEGRGFEQGFLPRAFERFSRSDPARARGGAGLGLSIVQVIAEAHGGRAHAANRDGGGADVWLSLPRS